MRLDQSPNVRFRKPNAIGDPARTNVKGLECDGGKEQIKPAGMTGEGAPGRGQEQSARLKITHEGIFGASVPPDSGSTQSRACSSTRGASDKSEVRLGRTNVGNGWGRNV